MDAVGDFFAELAGRDHEPRLEATTGTLRFDVTEGRTTRRWLLTVAKGDVTVSRQNAAADLVVRCERGLMEKIVRGKANATAAFLRGAITVVGDTELLVAFQRLLPRPRRARPAGTPAGYASRRR